MVSFIKQIRVRFSGVGQENTEESYSSKDRRTPLRRTQSFRREKKRDQNWFRRQFSRNMSRDYSDDSENQMEHVTAVAAAAYAIISALKDEKNTSGAPESFFTRLRSKNQEDTPIQAPEPGGVSKWFSGKEDAGENVTAAMDEKKPEKATGPPPPSMKKTLTFAEHLNSPPDTTKSKRAPERVPSSSMKKTPTFSNEVLNSSSSGGGKPEGVVPKTDTPPEKLGSSSANPDFPGTETRKQSPTRPGINETHADDWEKAKLSKIKERNEKLNATILSWENKKKKKASIKLDKTKSELELKRKRALQRFRSDLETIDRIAGGARAQAEERRGNEELKAKEKANMIRTTGRVPSTCVCFSIPTCFRKKIK